MASRMASAAPGNSSSTRRISVGEMRTTVERLTGRRVAAFMSANHHEPDASVEVFLLERDDANGAGNGTARIEGVG